MSNSALIARVDRFCKADHSDERPDARRNKDAHVKVPDPVHERSVKPQRHEQSREAHARRDDTERQTESAEQIPEEIRSYFYGEQLETDQDREDHDHADYHRDKGTFASALLASFTEQRRQHSGDQSDENTDRRIRIFLQKEGEYVRYSEKSDSSADRYRNQRRYV